MTAPRSSRGQRRPAVSPPVDPTIAPTVGDRSGVDDGADAQGGTEGARARAEGVDAVQGAELAAVRTGDDTRRRGWFWHWNSIVTQYAPLIGLKGVGLLNSYTVWTDRRESSPMRGYAFPSQQSEADFYGEDRAELIAINKILVALDLIEIKKEMVLRVDEHGHRWRVPHNLYRVKDTDDSRGLTTADVLRVTQLAERDAAVYRYLRRVFSARFSPIDPANVWHAILPEVRDDPAWQRLAAKTAREEERFSARSRAGHASRRAVVNAEPTPIAPPPAAGDGDGDAEDAEDIVKIGIEATGTDIIRVAWNGDISAAEMTANDTDRVGRGTRSTTSVGPSNHGSPPEVARSNSGLESVATIVGPTIVGPTNQARPTDVAPSNTIEDQSTTTTTTTRRADENKRMDDRQITDPATSRDNVVYLTRPVTALDVPVTGAVTTAGGMLSQRVFELATAEAPPLSDSTAEVGDTLAGSRDRRQSVQRDDEALALTAFEAANGGRVATPAEVQILRQLASQLDRIAAEDAELTTGWAWIGAAVYEAVDAGSAYVAPRRIREIATRWQREGRPGAAPSPIGDPLTAALPSTTLSMLTADRHGNDTDRSAGRDRRARRTGGAVDGAHFPDALTLSGRVDSLAAAADRGAARSSDGAPAVPARPGATSTGDADPGHDVPALWDAIVRELARSIDPDRLSGLTDAVTVTGLTPDEIELTAPSAIAAALGGEDGPLLTRALSAVLRRTVRLTIRPLPDVYPTPDEPSASESRPHHVPVGESFTGSLARGRSTHSATPSADAPETAQTASIGSHPLVTGDRTSATAATTPMPASAHRVGGIGLSDVHLWAAVVDEVVRAGDVTTANVTAWLKPARIAGRTPAGAHILAAPSDIARRRLDGPLRPALETALARVLGPAATLEVTTASRRDAT